MTKVEPILDPNYWKNRLRRTTSLHHSVFMCGDVVWKNIEASHRRILANLVEDNESIIDVGCGYGRMIEVLPPTWRGKYLGVDLCPELIDLAYARYPKYSFCPGNISELTSERLLSVVQPNRWDTALLVSIKHMVIRNVGEDYWNGMHAKLATIANRIIYLEYDPEDTGTVEILTNVKPAQVKPPRDKLAKDRQKRNKWWVGRELGSS